MKTIRLNALLVSTCILFAGSVLAHDPSKHKSQAEKPKCEAMQEMDHAKIDANDAVMLAMMKKCKAKVHHQDKPASDHHKASGSAENVTNEINKAQHNGHH